MSGVSHGANTIPPFPGGTGLTALDVYDWSSEDGLCGGTPHVHLACSECYVVVSGHGALHTLTVDDVREVTLDPGDVVWFTPGTVHRSVNADGSLRVVAVMSNGGLPEAGDAVMTLPSAYLADPERYRQAVSLGGPDAPDEVHDGAATQVWLATSDDDSARVTGRYVKRFELQVANPEASDRTIQDGLLARLAEVTGVGLPSR